MEINNNDGRAKVIAYYLPQFYPCEFNDKWYGKGFTEWTNVGKAKPLFPGHYQPKVPADLGYYDLRLEEIAEKQAELAREAGIFGFAYGRPDKHFQVGFNYEMPFYDYFNKSYSPDGGYSKPFKNLSFDWFRFGMSIYVRRGF